MKIIEGVRKRTNWDIKEAQKTIIYFPLVLCSRDDPTQSLHVQLLYNMQESTLPFMRMFYIVLCGACQCCRISKLPGLVLPVIRFFKTNVGLFEPK